MAERAQSGTADGAAGPAARRRLATASSGRRPSSSSRSLLISILSTGGRCALGSSWRSAALAIFVGDPDVEHAGAVTSAGFFGLPRAGDSDRGPGAAPRPSTSLAVVVLIAIAVAVSIHRPDTGWFAFFYYASTAASTVRTGVC